MDYPTLNAESVKKVIGEKVFLEWEEAKAELLGGKLEVPEPQRARHYTGIVLKCGEDKDGNQIVDERIKPGMRVFFEQFSNFEKFQSEDGKKRYAFVRDTDCYAIIPKRSKVSAGDWTQYGEGEE